MSTPFTLFLSGAEIPGWKKLLEEQGSPMAVSFWALYHRRLPKTKPYLMADRFAGDYPLLLESGGHSVNSGKTRPDQKDPEHLKAYAERYEQFITDNIERLTLVTEFDALPLGRAWIEERRRSFYNNLPPKKFVAIWHEEWGLEALQDMASTYDVIGVSSTIQKSGRNLTPVLNGLVRSGIHLHGVGLTKPEELRAVNFASTSSGSWFTPSKFGDTIFWDGNRLHRYPMKYKERSRRQNQPKITKAGFDAVKVLADDTTEVLRLSIWSWMQQAESLRARRTNTVRPALNPFSTDIGEEVTDTDDEQVPGDYEAIGDDESVTDLPAVRKPGTVATATVRDEHVLLPVFGIEVVTSEETLPDDTRVTHETRLIRSRLRSSRVCDNCYVADVCPLFAQGAECAYDIPVEARTKEQRTALMDGMIEMQTQRVAFMRFAEERNGGMADPNLSMEIDRLFKLIAKKAEIEDDRDYFEASIKGRAKSSTMGRLFGERAPEREMVSAVPTMDPLAIIEASLRGE